MARTVGKLSALKVARDVAPGMYADGAGLYLQVTGAVAQSWIYRFSLNGKAREMGLGPLSVVSLSEARIKAGEYRRSNGRRGTPASFRSPPTTHYGSLENDCCSSNHYNQRIYQLNV